MNQPFIKTTESDYSQGALLLGRPSLHNCSSYSHVIILCDYHHSSLTPSHLFIPAYPLHSHPPNSHSITGRISQHLLFCSTAKKKQNLCVIFIKNNEAYHNPPCPSPQTHFLLGCTRPTHFTPPRLHPHFQRRLQQSDTSPIVGGTECRNINMGIYEDKKIIFISVCVL